MCLFVVYDINLMFFFRCAVSLRSLDFFYVLFWGMCVWRDLYPVLFVCMFVLRFWGVGIARFVICTMHVYVCLCWNFAVVQPPTLFFECVFVFWVNYFLWSICCFFIIYMLSIYMSKNSQRWGVLFTSVVCLFVIIVFTAVKVLLDKNPTDLEG